jgi:enoyl-CoA hydratase
VSGPSGPDEPLLLEREGDLAIIIFNRPRARNAISTEMWHRLQGYLRALATDDSVRVVLFRGAGERALASGADIGEFGQTRNSREGAVSAYHLVSDSMNLVERLPQPTIALIHGYAVGAGCELAIACDLRVAAEDAQIGQPEIKLGLLPGGGGTQRLPRLVGGGRALLMNMTGDPISGAEAYEWGLVELVVPPGEQVDAAREVARTLSERSPHAIAIVKDVARETRDLPLEEGLRREAEAFRRCLASEDGQEGVAAFIEKREPVWTGR